MKWIEVIKISVAENRRTALEEQIVSIMSDLNKEENETIKLYQNLQDGEFSIHLFWENGKAAPRGSARRPPPGDEQEQQAGRFTPVFQDGIGCQGGGKRDQAHRSRRTGDQVVQDRGDALAQIGMGGQSFEGAYNLASLRVEQAPVGVGAAGVNAQVYRIWVHWLLCESPGDGL